MARTTEVPTTLLQKMARAADAFAQFEEELEDYLISEAPEIVGRLREARAAHLAGAVRDISELKRCLI